MADSKISALTDGGGLLADDEIAVNRSGSSDKARGVGTDGWISDTSETWTYASGSGGGTATFTVSGDQTGKYTVGTRIKLTQTTVKYFVVIAVSVASGTTTVTITAGSDYTLANAAISSNYHSYMANPQGYPGWFNYSPTIVGWSGTPTTSAKFALIGHHWFVAISITGTSNSTTTTATLPLTTTGAASTAFTATDGGAGSATPGRASVGAGGGTITFAKDWSGAAFGNSGTKTVGLSMLSGVL